MAEEATDFQSLMEKEGFTPESKKQKEGNQPEQTGGTKQTDQSTTGQQTKQEPDDQTKTDNTSEKESQPDDQKTTTSTDTEEGKTTTRTDQKDKDKGEGEDKDEGTDKKIEEQDVLSYLNSNLQTEFKSVEDLKNLMSYKEQAEKAQTTLQDYENKINERDQMIEQIGNPYNVFSNETSYKINKLISDGLPPKVASEIAEGNFDQMDDDEALVLDYIRNNPKASNKPRDVIVDMINDDYRLNEFEEEEDDLTEKQKQRLNARKMRKQSDADLARQELKQMSDIQTPEQKNKAEEIRQQNEEKAKQFKPIAEEIIEKDLDKIKVGNKEQFEYVIDDSFKDVLREGDNLTRVMINEFDPNDPNSRQQVAQNMKELFKVKNFDKIADALAESVKTRMQEEFDKKVTNPKEKNYSEGVEPSDEERHNAEEMERMKRQLGNV